MVKIQHSARLFAERIIARRFKQFSLLPTCLQYCIHKSEINESFFNSFVADEFSWVNTLAVDVEKVGSYLVITVRLH